MLCCSTRVEICFSVKWRLGGGHSLISSLLVHGGLGRNSMRDKFCLIQKAIIFVYIT